MTWLMSLVGNIASFSCVRWTCYKLEFVTEWGKQRVYWGITELRGQQDQNDACRIRRKFHIDRPLECIKTGVQSTFALRPVGRVMTQSNCLAQEAINVAVALGNDSTARGACYSCVRLGTFLQNNALRIRRLVKHLQGQDARDAVFKYAADLDESHPLRKHLAGELYATSKDKTAVKVDLPQKVRSGRSGKPGCHTRKKQLAKGRPSN